MSFPKKVIPIVRSSDYEYTLFFDGCSKGNPGPAGAGAVIYRNGEEIWANSIYVGTRQTNNVAEYTGMIIGLEAARDQGIKHIAVKGDSQLVIKQMNGEYKVHSTAMLPLYTKSKELQKSFDSITFTHVYRQYNCRADELSNQGLEKRHVLMPNL